jgi:hypothetical protein
MKPIANTTIKSYTLRYDLGERRFLDCLLCHKPMEGTVYMHSACWTKSSDGLHDRAGRVRDHLNRSGETSTEVLDLLPGDLRNKR